MQRFKAPGKGSGPNRAQFATGRPTALISLVVPPAPTPVCSGEMRNREGPTEISLDLLVKPLWVEIE